ncbi:hypothetical protein, conserved [Angomonas deanei]|uniref:Uncharacterized protein n=1 Tax=Angomonas deanei TaxID=59799 RepID=A0A7G2C1N1_9TRYP|nr:hypothetical protein, conserved [Angomonas deanei]
MSTQIRAENPLLVTRQRLTTVHYNAPRSNGSKEETKEAGRPVYNTVQQRYTRPIRSFSQVFNDGKGRGNRGRETKNGSAPTVPVEIILKEALPKPIELTSALPRAADRSTSVSVVSDGDKKINGSHAQEGHSKGGASSEKGSSKKKSHHKVKSKNEKKEDANPHQSEGPSDHASEEELSSGQLYASHTLIWNYGEMDLRHRQDGDSRLDDEQEEGFDTTESNEYEFSYEGYASIGSLSGGDSAANSPTHQENRGPAKVFTTGGEITIPVGIEGIVVHNSAGHKPRPPGHVRHLYANRGPPVVAQPLIERDDHTAAIGGGGVATDADHWQKVDRMNREMRTGVRRGGGGERTNSAGEFRSPMRRVWVDCATVSALVRTLIDGELVSSPVAVVRPVPDATSDGVDTADEYQILTRALRDSRGATVQVVANGYFNETKRRFIQEKNERREALSKEIYGEPHTYTMNPKNRAV